MNVLDAYLLTRQWKDTPNGVELTLWASSDNGPVKISITSQKPVCFVERHLQPDLPQGVQRKAVDLKLLHGSDVDALYFQQQRQLQQCSRDEPGLCESDIKPADRFLMERFIKSGMRINGAFDQQNGFLHCADPQVQACHYEPSLTMLSVDIETRAHTQDLYSIAAAPMDGSEGVVFMIGSERRESHERYTLIFKDTEKKLLNAFFDWVKEKDPDVLIGWAIVNFDLNFLDNKCRALGLPFRLGRNNESAAVLQPGSAGTVRIARVPGRAVIDGIDQLKAGFWAFESYSLDNVSNELLGTGKLISSDIDKVAQINHLFSQDKSALADYNFRDCTLVNEIFQKANLLEFAQQRANLTGLALDRLGGSVAAFDNLYLPRLHRKGFVAPNVPTHTDGLSSPGGYVMESMPGLYQNVLVLDFKSLYPSIIRTFFIDPMGLSAPGVDPLPGFEGATFSRNNHILPELIEELWMARDDAKKARDAPLSQAIKIIMNSFYGVLGTNGCRFYSQQLASSITRRGHEIITRSRTWIEDQDFDVIYGDTDSLFVWVGDDRSASDCFDTGKQLMLGLNEWWREQLLQAHGIESHLEVEYETHYLKFFMPTVRGTSTGSKKRYAGLSAVNKKDNQSQSNLDDTSSELVIKGLEAARTDWTPLAREFQRTLFTLILNDEPFEQYIKDIADKLLSGTLDQQLIYRKRLRRQLNDYQRNVPPHVKAARKLQSNGSHIRYIITRNGPEPVDLQQSPPDYQHYMEKQLAPAADGILKFMDTSFAAITDAQLQMF